VDKTTTQCVLRFFRRVLFQFCPGLQMPIVMISEALLLRERATDGRILRDRMLCGFCVCLRARRRTFMVATSVAGKQFRMTLGHWPLISVDEARVTAMAVLRECRAGRRPITSAQRKLPTLRELLPDYCKAKKIKDSSKARYESVLRVHFTDWQDRAVDSMGTPEFGERCKVLGQTKGAAMVELIRGLIGALIRYVNAVYGLKLSSPFDRLAGAGLLPERAKPRARVLQVESLCDWFSALDRLEQGPRTYLLVTLLTGMRKNEVRGLRRCDVDLYDRVLRLPDTKNGRPHSLPISGVLAGLLEPLCATCASDAQIFKGVSADHAAEMAQRAGAPKFMLHDLRKLLATTGQKMGVADAVMRRILNHTAPKTDVMHRHYVSLTVSDVALDLERIQAELLGHGREET
jgi:integrase